MSVAHTCRLTVAKHQGPHRTAKLEGFDEPIHFGVHGGIRAFYRDKYGKDPGGPDHPATLDHLIAAVAG